jgi:hypothetical protein
MGRDETTRRHVNDSRRSFGQHVLGNVLSYVPDDAVRPHVAALFGPEGNLITRDLRGEVPEGSDDHVHHKGVWWGHRDVNGADVWTEFPGHGRIASSAEPEWSAANGVERLRHRTVWLDGAGSALLEDDRVLRVHQQLPDGTVAIDIEASIRATSRDVRLADTKEAGLVAVRVTPSMEERRGGVIELATGARGEANCWGRAAEWCDYTGMVGGQLQGIAVLDHPGNPVPAYWHVRDYGLLAVNPFGLRDFRHDPSQDGSLTLTSNRTALFRYRLLVHRGDARDAGVAEHYRRFADVVTR